MEIQFTLPDDTGPITVIATAQRIVLAQKDPATGEAVGAIAMGTPDFLRVAEKLQDLLDD